MVNSTSLSPDVATILETVQRREEYDHSISIEDHYIQLVVCLLKECYYAFPGESIQEIVTVPAITYVPGVPACLLGVIYVRGNIESVLDLRQVLGLPAGPISACSRIALGQVGEFRSGLLVDSIEDVLEISEDEILKPALDIGMAGTAFVAGETMYNGRPLIVLDLCKIFDTLLVPPDTQ